jgi:hypothetical protein
MICPLLHQLVFASLITLVVDGIHQLHPEPAKRGQIRCHETILWDGESSLIPWLTA